MSFSWCTEKKKPYLKWDVSNLYFPCFIRRRKQICFVGAAAPAQWQINSSSFDITVHIIISSTNGRGLTLWVLARATWQRGGMSLLPAEMLQEGSVEKGPPFPARGTGWHGYKAPALGFPEPFGSGTGPPPLCAPPVCRMEPGGRDGHGAGTCQLGESQNALGVYGTASLEPFPGCSPTRGEAKHIQGWGNPGPTGRHRIRFANLT